MAAMAGGSKPLRLKDLLELDCESCSAAGFRCYPRRLCVAGVAAAAAPTAAASSPMRHRLEADRSSSSSSSMRRPKLSNLSKSLSRRLRGGFWRRREEEEEEEAAAPAASSTAPAVTSCCSSSSDYETSESSNSTGRKSHSHSEYSEFSSASSDDSLHTGEPSTTGADHEVMKRGSEEEADDKEQLSPVGVMDFPFDEDDGEDEDAGAAGAAAAVEEEERVAASACSFSFSDSLAQLQRRKMQLQPKIRRLGSTGELSGVDLEARFAALESDHLAGVVPVQHQCITDDVAAPPPRYEDHRNGDVSEKDPDEDSLLDLLADTVSVGVVDDVTERLLLDFFVEAKGSSRHIELRAPISLLQERRRRENGQTLRLAKAWLEGTGTLWSLNDVLYHGEDVMAEMERSRQWMHTGEEVREAGVVVAAMVMDELLHELVSDLIAA